MKIVVTGATGFIGKAAVIHLARSGHEITAIVRRNGAVADLPCKGMVWDSSKDEPANLTSALNGSDAVIHLAGEPVANSRWNERVKESIRSSRVDGTRKIVEAFALLPADVRPTVLLSGSAIGIYGDRGDETLNETSSVGQGFLASVTEDWEREAMRAETLGVRVVLLRTGIVLGRNGGALRKMRPVILGDGAQWMSWIHLEDEVRFLEFAATHSEVVGACNLTAPNPVRNHEFTRKLAKVRGVPIVIKVPRFALKAALGELSGVLFESCKALPERAVAQGFRFSYPTLDEALGDIYPSGDLRHIG
jgi:uncharacterized protein (TIGR01777 family)